VGVSSTSPVDGELDVDLGITVRFVLDSGDPTASISVASLDGTSVPRRSPSPQQTPESRSTAWSARPTSSTLPSRPGSTPPASGAWSAAPWTTRCCWGWATSATTPSQWMAPSTTGPAARTPACPLLGRCIILCIRCSGGRAGWSGRLQPGRGGPGGLPPRLLGEFEQPRLRHQRLL